jgi:hypothetical protein
LETEPGEDNDLTKAISQLATGFVKQPEIVAVSGGEFGQFSSIEEVREFMSLIADRQQAEAILRSLAIQSSSSSIQEDDIRRLRLSTGIAVSFDADYLWKQIDELEEQSPKMYFDFDIAVGAVTSMGALGYVLWTLRGGALIAAALTQLPTWAMIDPLPVLECYKDENKLASSDSVEQFFD